MIPKNINRNHILEAIKEVDDKGVPGKRYSNKYIMAFNERLYPPKYIISIANKYANGEMLDSETFSGGKESNSFLQEYGFTIYSKEYVPDKKERKTKKDRTKRIKSTHSENCPDCKRTIEEMLIKIYGEVKVNYKFNIGVHPTEYIHSPYYRHIQRIFESLQEFRGYRDFIKTSNLPRVDYYIPDPGFIIEFDESQHFTTPRKVALSNYPDKLKLGFLRQYWIKLCEKLKRKDSDPSFRDEQRAWYDTLRDFLPTLLDLGPTVRLYANDYQWCKLNPENTEDINKFKMFLEVDDSPGGIEVRKDPDPTMARIVIAGEWDGTVKTARTLLKDICDKWPEKERVDFLISCGAFLTFDWPPEIKIVRNNKYPDIRILNQLKFIAIEQCKLLLDNQLKARLKNLTDYITIGIDSFKDKISVSQAMIRQPHIEMVALVDLASDKIHLTGKSYPTAGQQDGLVRFDDLGSHFVSTTRGKVMLLGCHDLNVFNPRGEATTRREWRRKVRRDFYDLINKEEPDIVLHHPHTTDS
ncbi:MAG: hypothetical protein RQ743_12120, partial [Bacteroidales bacterium]|nr:hypothetical protein [Bacteroidales bacterium]